MATTEQRLAEHVRSALPGLRYLFESCENAQNRLAWVAWRDEAGKLVDQLAEQAASEGRTDREIVDQTEDLAREFLRVVFQRELPLSVRIRDNDNPRAKQVWAMACYAQELLTDTDVENAVAGLDEDPVGESASPVVEVQPAPYSANRNSCLCHWETCCCDPWVVFSPKGEKVAGFTNQQRAEAAAAAYTMLGRHE